MSLLGFGVCSARRQHRLRHRTFAERYGRYLSLRPERSDKTSCFIDRHGGTITVLPQLIEEQRHANGIIAGTSGMRWSRFLFFNAVGAALWVAARTGVGYFSGGRIDAIYASVTRYDTYFAIAIGASLLSFVVRRMMRGRGPRAGGAI